MLYVSLKFSSKNVLKSLKLDLFKPAETLFMVKTI